MILPLLENRMFHFRKIPVIVIFNLILIILIGFTIFFPRFIMDSLSDLFLDTGPLGKRKQRTAVEIQESFRNIYSVSRDSVVTIRTKTAGQIIRPYYFFNNEELQRVSSLGSGFLIDDKGYIITNYHVIRNAEMIEVIDSKGRIYIASWVGSHERADIAILKIAEKHKITSVYLGDSDKVEVGDWAIAIGAPYGLEKTFTVGVVSAKTREDLDETGQTYIQVDTAINPGSSGGPLFNIYGEVVGINRMIRSGSGENTGIGFAIPINYALTVVNLIKQNPGVNIRPKTLGVKATVPHPDHRRILGLETSTPGIVVYSIEEKSSAFYGGLMRYDFITKANGVVINDINDLRKQIGLVGLDGRLKLEIIRKGKFVTLNIRLLE